MHGPTCREGIRVCPQHRNKVNGCCVPCLDDIQEAVRQGRCTDQREEEQIEAIGGKPVITDIIIEGVSLVVSQRADFSSIIRQQGGLDGLIGLLRQKLASN